MHFRHIRGEFCNRTVVHNCQPIRCLWRRPARGAATSEVVGGHPGEELVGDNQPGHEDEEEGGNRRRVALGRDRPGVLSRGSEDLTGRAGLL
jgi:hypothetical protein